jgi:hypothetical protein
LLSLALTAALSAQTAVDPRVIQLLPPDSAVVFGLQWKQFSQSEAAKSFQQQIHATMPVLAAQSGLNQFQDFLMNDLDSLIVAIPAAAAAQLASSRTGKAGAKASATNPPMLVVLKGRFNLAKIREWGKEKKGETEVYQDYELLRIGSKPPMRATVLDGTTMLVGARKDVVSAIDRRKGVMPAPAVNSLTTRLAELASSNDIFLSADIPSSAFAGKEVPPMMAAFRDLSSLDLGMSFQQGMAMRANLITKTGESAKSLATTLQTLMLLAAQNDKDPQAAEMVRKLAITPAGRSVTLGLTLSQVELDAMIKQRATQTATRSFSGPPRISGPAEVATQVPSAAPESTSKTIRITGLDGGPVEFPAGGSKK